MGITNATNLSLAAGTANARTTFESKYEEFFAGGMPGTWQLFTDKNTGKTEYKQFEFITNQPVMRKWVGSRIRKYMRHYSTLLQLETYEATMEIARKLIQYGGDPDTIGKAIDTFMRLQATAYDKAFATAIDSNSGAGPTGYDGVGLFSAAHPHASGGGTQSNLSAGTNLSWSSFDSLRAGMRTLTFENGEPANVVATHARCGPLLESRFKSILEAKERIRFTDMTTADTTTLAQNATAVTNVWAGELTLIVDPRVTGYYWDLYDLSKPGVRPIILYEGQAPHPVNQDQMTDKDRFENDVFVYGLEGDFTFDAGMWMVAARATGTA